ncbi:uncharacterized protein B0H64DRAFT_234111 [Chaetomium fimeti]|uniref:Uncharacterized protein n=1 Tax=Chaetomium fimeti TaxID=1854472 RepID=A0AAE0H9Y9_9PEZI|nr:hypothetical protein B0H64DRAFT_234111 [Chaetomium fimeti]
MRCPRSVLVFVPVTREQRPFAGNQDAAMLRARNLINSTQDSLEDMRACCSHMHPHHAVSSPRPRRSCNTTGQMGLGGLMRLALGCLGGVSGSCDWFRCTLRRDVTTAHGNVKVEGWTPDPLARRCHRLSTPCPPLQWPLPNLVPLPLSIAGRKLAMQFWLWPK